MLITVCSLHGEELCAEKGMIYKIPGPELRVEREQGLLFQMIPRFALAMSL